MKKGSKNLLILGIAAIIIAVLTTTASLVVYHDSGDIYLDLSRPLFSNREKDNQPQNIIDHEYEFSERQGQLTVEELEEYLIELEEAQNKLQATPDPYSPASISDEVLGIPAE